jgi:sulfur-oxidizing protein SoxY
MSKNAFCFAACPFMPTPSRKELIRSSNSLLRREKQMFKRINPFKAILFFLSLGFSATILAGGEEDTAWNGRLKPRFFGDKAIQETNDIIELTAPNPAEDAALVPISIASKIPQTPKKYIKTITLIIDNNPEPFAVAFSFTPDSGKADMGLRARVNVKTPVRWQRDPASGAMIRVNASPVRAIAETNDGKLTMSRVFVKASGGCTEPVGADMEAAMARMGKMKFRLDANKLTLQQPNQAQLLISHPNITGMQVEQVKVSFNGKPIMTAQTGMGVSADPSFRFYFKPDKAGELKAEISDNKGNQFTDVQKVTP